MTREYQEAYLIYYTSISPLLMLLGLCDSIYQLLLFFYFLFFYYYQW
jgi:hypothetical protein